MVGKYLFFTRRQVERNLRNVLNINDHLCSETKTRAHISEPASVGSGDTRTHTKTHTLAVATFENACLHHLSRLYFRKVPLLKQKS